MTTSDGQPLFKLLRRKSDDGKEPMLFKCLKCVEEAKPFTSKTMSLHALHIHKEREFIVDLRNLNKGKEPSS